MEEMIKDTDGDISKDKNVEKNLIWADSRDEKFIYAIGAIEEKIGRRKSQSRYFKESSEYENYTKAIEVLRNYPATIKAYEHEINQLKQQLDEQPSNTKLMELLKVDVEFLSKKTGRHDMLIHRLEREHNMLINRLELKIEELLTSFNDK